MDDSAAIRDTAASWIGASLDRDWAALLALCTNDVVFSLPGVPNATGLTLMPFLDTFPDMKVLSLAFDWIDVSGHLATAAGTGSCAIDVNGRLASVPFTFVNIFEKGADGRWRFAHVIWNLAPSPARPRVRDNAATDRAGLRT